ncbi:LysR family transcriptional regulator [Dongia mobilis]|jgi:LysR family glycine cleavage system transcriptional activator|uniref:LysR family transcriptional regulator n=1 Tax=Dongia sp. TaxID=1977262 RepID=UPI0026F21A2A
MAERMPMLPALRAFEAVARLGSVRAAASELHVTPAAVSQQVKAMEADLGVQLIRRRGNALELTEAARAGSDTLSAGFRLLVEAVRQFRDHRMSPQIRLSVDPTLAASWLIARLPR